MSPDVPKGAERHKFILRCSGRLEFIGYVCFLYGTALTPAGCRMGRGAEASEGVLPLLVSIASPAVTSMGCSTELLGRREGQALSVGPQDQQSPPTNFTGLENKNSEIFLYLRSFFYLREIEKVWINCSDGLIEAKPKSKPRTGSICPQ